MLFRRRANGLLVSALVLMGTWSSAWGQDADDGEALRYFYHGLSYGSDANFHPARELINGAFGILQISSNWRTLDEIDFANGLDVTWNSITHPVGTVDAYGRSEFVSSEMFPATFRWNNLQYVPNYLLHLIGGGARNRAFSEWYRAHDVAGAGWWAGATTMAHAFAVETVEHQGENRATVDPVADMFFFDPAGAILFSNDRVAHFFSRKLNMRIWSGQPVYNPVLNSIENAGENYGLHYFFKETHRVGFFTYWGMSSLLGATVRGGNGLDWSVGLGGAVDRLNEIDRGTNGSALYARVKVDAGVFLHRDGSLLASVQFSEAWTQRLRVNVYPGVVGWRGVEPGLYMGIRGDDVIIGVNVAAMPIGLGGSR